MTIAEERYEKAWNSFMIYLNHQRFYYTDLYKENRLAFFLANFVFFAKVSIE